MKAIQNDKFELLTKTPQNIDIIEKNPEIILKILTEMEYRIIKILFFSKVGITARDIQKEIILENIEEAIEDVKNGRRPIPMDWEGSWKGKKMPKDHYDNIRFFYRWILLGNYGKATTQTWNAKEKKWVKPTKPIKDTTNETIKKARKWADVPSHNTIKRNLDNLFQQGFIGRKKYPERKKISFIYFINPKIYSILKSSKIKLWT